MKPLGEASEVFIDAMKAFMDYWERVAKGLFELQGFSPKEKIKVRKHVRAIYVSAYIRAYEDFTLEFAKDTFKNINDDLKELHNLFPD